MLRATNKEGETEKDDEKPDAPGHKELLAQRKGALRLFDVTSAWPGADGQYGQIETGRPWKATRGIERKRAGRKKNWRHSSN